MTCSRTAIPRIWHSRSLYQPRGRQAAITWELFAERAANPKSAASKEGLARWAAVEFRGAYRCMAGVLRAHATVVIDVDDGKSTLQTITETLGELYIIVHSTFRAIAEYPRWRVIAPLDHPVDAEGYGRAFRWLAMRLEAAGARPDFGARDASHAWAVPARPPSGYYVCRVIPGAFVSVEEAFATIPAPEPLPEPTRADRTDSYDRRSSSGRASTSRRCRAASRAARGSTTTFKAAVAMVRGFGLEPGDALRLLVDVHNPMCAPAWSLWELKHKVKQAHQRSRLPFGAIAERGRAA